jgi:hypothetical protein
MSESIKSSILEYATTLLGKVPNLIEAGVEAAKIVSTIRNGMTSIQTMQAKGRGPTPAEWDQLNSDIDQLENKVYGENVNESGGGAGSTTATQMRIHVIGGMTGGNKPKPPAPAPSPAPSPAPTRGRSTRIVIGGMATGATNDPDPGSDPDTIQRNEPGNVADRTAEQQRREDELRERGSGSETAKRNVDENKDGVTDQDPESQEDKTRKARDQGGVPGDPDGVVGDNRGTAPR